MKLTKQQMIDRAAALEQQRTGTQTRSALAQAISATQQQIRQIEAISDPKQSEVRLLKTLRTRSDKQNAFLRHLDDADVKRAAEKVRSRRAQRVDQIDVRTANRDELRGRALDILERDGGHLSPAQQDHFDALVSEPTEYVNTAEIAKRTITSMAPAYISAFRKAMDPVRQPLAWTAEEGAAVAAYRAASEGTTTAGGFGVPVLIDPTIIPSAGDSSAPVVQLSTVVTVTTDKWAGVTSTGTSWQWKGEGSAATDDAPTLAQPSIPVYTANGWIEFSYQLGADYPGWAEEAQRVLAQGYVDMLAEDTVAGSGSSQPYGVFNRMMGVTTNPSHIVCQTAGHLSAVDVRAAWQALPQRWRSNATWLAHSSTETLVKGFAAGASEVDYAQTLTESGTRISALEGRPFISTDYAPNFAGSTSGTVAACVVGDFRGGFRVISRAGMELELVKTNVPDQSTFRPTMSHGWYATARLGWDTVVNEAFVVIANS